METIKKVMIFICGLSMFSFFWVILMGITDSKSLNEINVVNYWNQNNGYENEIYIGESGYADLLSEKRTTIYRDLKNFDRKALLLYIEASKVKVEVFSNTEENLLVRETITTPGYHILVCPGGYSNVTVQIAYYWRKIGREKIYPVWVGEPQKLLVYVIKNKLPSIIVGIILLVLALIESIVSLVLLKSNHKSYELLFLSGYCYCIGVYTLIRSGMLPLFGLSGETISLCRNILLTLVPLFMTAFIKEIRAENLKLAKLINIWLTVLVIAACAMVALDLFQYVAWENSLLYYHIGSNVIMILNYFIDIYTTPFLKSKKEKLIFAGLGAMCTLGALDLVHMNLAYGKFENKFVVNEELMPLGSIIFVICVLITKYLKIEEEKKYQIEKETLFSLAYRDEMTQLYNRRKSREIFSELQQNRKPYIMINFDLNNLKKVNDYSGHDKGDLLIEAFTRCLIEVFGKYENLFRMGGDEFLVILPEISEGQLEQYLKEINYMESQEAKRLGIAVSASYGVAYSKEVVENNSAMVYGLADERMYQMKKIYHQKTI